MALATAGADGAPRSATSAARGRRRGFVFYTNHGSRKGASSPRTRARRSSFLWRELDRQMSVTGRRRAGRREDESDAYFATRPREAQLGAWASTQSTVLDDRDELRSAFAASTRRFAGDDVPRPPYWGGYLHRPDTVEFWQGRRTGCTTASATRARGDGWTIGDSRRSR